MSSDDLFFSVARILLSTSSKEGPAGPTNTSPSSVVAEQLENAGDEQKPTLARLLAELLEREEIPNKSAQTVLHNHIRSLIVNASLNDSERAHSNLASAGDLADEDILRELLVETAENVSNILGAARQSHISSDEAFETDPTPFWRVYAPQMLEDSIEESVDLQNKIEVHDTVLRLLQFWHLFFLTNTESTQHVELFRRAGEVFPIHMLAALGLRDKKLASSCYDVLCQLIKAHPAHLPTNSPQMIWDGIRLAIDAAVNVNLALGLWLAWISTGSRAYIGPTQDILQQYQYWQLLQKSLTTGFSERRKFTLYILMNSMDLIRDPVDTRVFTFDPKARKALLSTWTKYSTLVEITSLSTSANQLRDATPDILRLLDPSSPIKSSWMVVLIALGFGSSSGGVHKAVWEMIISLNQQRSVRLFATVEGRRFLQGIILPYAVQSNNFSLMGASPDVCAHGSAMSKFIATTLQTDDVEAKNTAVSVLQFLEEKGDLLFSPARIYILKGLVDGLKGRTVFHESDIVRLLVTTTKLHRFTKMNIDVCIVIVMRLLLSVDIKHIGLDSFMTALGDIIYRREYLLSEPYMRSLAEYIVKSLSVAAVDEMAHRVLKRFDETKDLTISDLATVAVVLYLLPYVDGTKFRLPSTFIEMAHKTDRGLRLMTILVGNPCLFKKLMDQYKITGLFTSLLTDHHSSSSDEAFKSELAKLLTAIPAETFKTQYNGDVQILLDISRATWADVVSLADGNTEFVLEAEKKRTDLAVICAQTSGFLIGLKTENLPVGLVDVVEILETLCLPVLTSNKHENAEKVVTTESNVRSLLQLMNLCLAQTMAEDITVPIVARIMDLLPRLSRFLVNESLLCALESVQIVVSRAPVALKEYETLDELLILLWGIVDSCTLRHDFIKAYSGFLDTIFHPMVLGKALTNVDLTQSITTIANDLLRIGAGKRSVRPRFAKAIWNAFIQDARTVSSSPWLEGMILDVINFSTRSKDADFLLEQPLALIFDELEPGSDHYHEYSGETEIYAQAYIFDMLARFDAADELQNYFIKSLRNTIFTPWTQNFVNMPTYMPWKRATQLQTLVLTERFLEADEAKDFLETLIGNTLAHEPHPRYRFLIEWFMALCLIRYPEHLDLVWKPFEKIDKPNPKLVASLLRVGVMVSRGLDPAIREKFFSQLVYTNLMLTSHTKAVIRHQAVALVLEIWNDARKFGYSSLTSNAIFVHIHKAVIGSAYYKEHIAAKDFRTFDALTGFSLAGIFSGSYLTGGDDIELIKPHCFASIPALPSHPRFVVLSNEPVALSIDAAPVPNGIVTILPLEASKLEPPQITAPLQTKSPSWDPTLLLGPAVPKTHDVQTKETPELILCASLLDNPINLGGLSRVSEILGITKLTVSSMAYLASKEFTATSVHSESWLDIQELGIPDIPQYLRDMRAQGYEIVGIEQTDQSLVLGDGGRGGWRCRKKTVLVLGTEKYGMTPQVLAECDLCVEIPQRGVTRSMNVQTAAGVVLYECWRQWMN